MSRREYRASFKCAEPGCRDTQFFVATTRADEDELYARQKRNPYRCSRHKHPEQNLRPDNQSARYVLVASRVLSRLRPEEWLDGLFWHEEGKEHAGSGFAFGPGFNAYASDFPEGTRLVITAHIEAAAS